LKALNWSQGFLDRVCKTRKWQIEAKPTWHLFWRENELVRTKKISAKRRSSWFGEPRIIRLVTKVQSNSRIQFASNQSKLVLRKLDPGPSSKVGFVVPAKIQSSTQYHDQE
jgi:hypothetical protein